VLCLSIEHLSAGVFCAPLGTQIRLTDYLMQGGLNNLPTPCRDQ
jgi:hypothetical protein